MKDEPSCVLLCTLCTQVIQNLFTEEAEECLKAVNNWRMTSEGQTRGDWFGWYFCARVHRPLFSVRVTFYPEDRFFPSHEEIPQEFVDRFRGGFLHVVSRCSVTFSNLFLDACAGVKWSCTRSGPSLAFSILGTISPILGTILASWFKAVTLITTCSTCFIILRLIIGW